MNAFPLVTAHSGCMDTQDNSFESVRTGLALGADIIEEDIRVTRDGTPVLSHDDLVPMAAGRTAALSALTLGELHEVSAAPIVLLEHVLPIVKEAGRWMNLDIKTDECLKPVFALVERLDMADQVFLSGCKYGRAAKADACGRHISKLLNVDEETFLGMPYVAAAQKACDDSRNAGCFGLNVPYQLVRPELLELADRQQLSVYVWTVREEREMRRFAGMGVHSITTRDIATLLAVKAEWSRQGTTR